MCARQYLHVPSLRITVQRVANHYDPCIIGQPKLEIGMCGLFNFGFLAACLMAIATQSVADGDATKGEKLYMGFLHCKNCHSLEPGETKIGPTLAGIFGRKAGSVEGFNRYSEAMVNSGIVWDAETLDAFLKNPKEYIPGNEMFKGQPRAVGGVSSAQYRADLIAFLRIATAP